MQVSDPLVCCIEEEGVNAFTACPILISVQFSGSFGVRGYNTGFPDELEDVQRRRARLTDYPENQSAVKKIVCR